MWNGTEGIQFVGSFLFEGDESHGVQWERDLTRFRSTQGWPASRQSTSSLHHTRVRFNGIVRGVAKTRHKGEIQSHHVSSRRSCRQS